MDDATSKLAEHLRLVHFTLVVVAVTLLIATIERGVEGPQKDLDAIVNLVDAFRPESEKARGAASGILEKQVRELLFNKPPVQPSAGTLQITDKSRNLPIDINLSFRAPIATVFHSESALRWSDLRGTGGAYSDIFPFEIPRYLPIAPSIPDVGKIKRQLKRNTVDATGPWEAFKSLPPTIGNFQEFWDACTKMRHAYILESVVEPRAFLITAIEEPGSFNIGRLNSPLRNAPKFNPKNRFLVPLSTKWAIVEGDAQRSPPDEVAAQPEFLTVNHTWGQVGYEEFRRRLLVILRPYKGVYLEIFEFKEMKPGDILVTAKANYKHTPLNLQDHLLSLIQDEKRQRGLFERSFPGVQRFLTELRYGGPMDYELLNALFALERKRSGSPLEIAGLKIERNILRFWGVAVLLAVQIYFYLHLREFTTRSRAGDEGLRVAWIGLYPGLGSFFIFSTSIVALPTAVSTLILWDQFGSPNLSIVNVILCVFSISIAFVTTSLVKALRYLVNNAN